MSHKNLWRTSLLVFSLALTTVGCVRLSQPYPSRHYYAFTATPTTILPAKTNGPALKIRPFQINPLYAGKNFVYRSGDSQYEGDFYHAFFARPADQITAVTKEWCLASGKFASIDATAQPQFYLDGNIEALYGDFRPNQPPLAVLSITFYLFADKADGSTLVFTKSYRRQITIDDNTAENLIAGWNTALLEILGELVRELP